jgi:ribosomal protein L11 methyltransferase
LLASYLGEIGFESFQESENGFVAWIPDEVFDEALLTSLLLNFPYAENVTFNVETIVQENWNEAWEKNYFEPIIIDDICVVKSSFHKDVPVLKYNIIIDPKMSFGTGHHETTSLMISWLLGMDLTHKAILDMGCGTAVLAILAAMKGAKPVTAIDIDAWCIENSLENTEKNNVDYIRVFQGDASKLGEESYDIIIANINRNILLEDIKHYKNCLNPHGILLMSGFYKEDIGLIENESVRNGLILTDYKEKNNWVAVKTEYRV